MSYLTRFPAEGSTVPKSSLVLSELRLDWRLIVLQSTLLSLIAFIPNLALGTVLSFSMLALWRRWSNWREAVVAMFVLACVLASSRVVGLQYWKILRLLFAFLIFIEALRRLRGMSFSERRKSIGFLVVVWICTGLPAVLSEHVAAGLEETVLLSSMWWSMLVLCRTVVKEDTSRRLSTLVHVGLVVVTVCLSSRIVDYDVSHLNGRFRGIFGNPNEFSHWWLGLFVLGLVASHHLKNPRTIALLVLTAIFYFWTGTRGAMLAAIFSFGAWSLQGIQSSFFAQMTRLLFGCSVVLTLALFSSEALFEMLPEQVVREESLEEGGGRLLAWEHAIDQIKMRPWFGAGGGAEERYFRENYSYFAMQNHQGLSHNSWLAFAMNYGIPATLLLFFVLLSRLGLTNRSVLFVGLLPFLVSFSVEGWLTAPMSASSPILFFVGGVLLPMSEEKVLLGRF